MRQHTDGLYPAAFSNGEVSFWHSQIGLEPRRARMTGPLKADVCIVGAGLSGLWAAYYLKCRDPALDVVVLEREFAGFGASGRNGGWLSSELAGSREALAGRHGRDRVAELLREMNATVAEVLRVCAAESIDADIQRDGLVVVARNPAQAARLRAEFEYERAWGEDVVLLDQEQLARRVTVSGATEALFNKNAARVHPAKLVRGLARAVEAMGVRIFEGTPVTEIRPGIAKTSAGDARAGVVLDCVEGFNATLRSGDGRVIPLNSAMIVTDPINEDLWQEIGWPSATLVGDKAHAFMYAQRTADGRIALGGRGVPYRYGSRTDRRGITQRRTVRLLREVLHSMFPVTTRVGIAHAWCGVLGVRRD